MYTKNTEYKFFIIAYQTKLIRKNLALNQSEQKRFR